jgi:hypothetical protein
MEQRIRGDLQGQAPQADLLPAVYIYRRRLNSSDKRKIAMTFVAE